MHMSVCAPATTSRPTPSSREHRLESECPRRSPRSASRSVARSPRASGRARSATSSLPGSRPSSECCTHTTGTSCGARPLDQLTDRGHHVIPLVRARRRRRSARRSPGGRCSAGSGGSSCASTLDQHTKHLGEALPIAENQRARIGEEGARPETCRRRRPRSHRSDRRIDSTPALLGTSMFGASVRPGCRRRYGVSFRAARPLDCPSWNQAAASGIACTQLLTWSKPGSSSMVTSAPPLRRRSTDSRALVVGHLFVVGAVIRTNRGIGRPLVDGVLAQANTKWVLFVSHQLGEEVCVEELLRGRRQRGGDVVEVVAHVEQALDGRVVGRLEDLRRLTVDVVDVVVGEQEVRDVEGHVDGRRCRRANARTTARRQTLRRRWPWP